MYHIHTPEVVILRRALKTRGAETRLARMMQGITAGKVTEVDESDLAALLKSRRWYQWKGRTGAYQMERSPAIIFSAFRWPGQYEPADIKKKFPGLSSRLLGLSPWDFRDAGMFRAGYGCVCQSAWEIHCAFGCLHACDYCHVQPYYVIMLNLEELAEKLHDFGESIPWQKLYKFDNQTDTICLEPEYGASEIMVNLFAKWADRFLLLYTKSDNVDHLLGLDHRGHTLISWTISPETVASRIERRTPSLEARISAMERCEKAGYRVRIRFSPICPIKNWQGEYREMLRRVLARVAPEIISVDVLGWMDIPQMRSAIDLSLFDAEYVQALEELEAIGFQRNGKHVWPHSLRARILRFVINEIRALRPRQPLSICMETEQMWDELGPVLGMMPENYACCCGPTSVPGNPLLAGSEAPPQVT